jgi:hypothetical protein
MTMIDTNPHPNLQIVITWTFEVMVIKFIVFSEGLYPRSIFFWGNAIFF